MRSRHVILAVEDRLSEAVATKILTTLGFEIVRRPREQRNSYLTGKSLLRKRAPEFNRSATGPYYFFMLTDLDSPRDCPPKLIQSWLNAPLNPRFFLRVAVIEVESWVMADRRAIAKFLEISLDAVPSRTDEVLEPKEFLVSLARKSRSTTLRKGLVPGRGSQTLRIGPEYNTRLSEFVRDHWDLNRAAAVSPSLKKTVDRLRSTALMPYTD